MLTAALIIYLGVCLAVFYISKRWLKYNTANILFPLVVLNTIPLVTFPMSLTSMYAVDLLFPFILIFILINVKKIYSNRFLTVSFLLFIVLPFISLLWSLIRWTPDSTWWLIYLYRKFAIFSFILYCFIKYKDYDIRQLFNVSILFWMFLCLVGIGHYLGFYYADFEASAEDGIEASIFENSWLIQRGFMGLNRGATGVYSATFLSFSLSRMLFSSTLQKNERIIYMFSTFFSIAIFFLSGSRSGLVAAFGASTIALGLVLINNKKINLRYLIPIIIAVIAFLLYISSTSLLDRFSLNASEDSGTSRIDVQIQVLENSFSDIQSFLIGNGARSFSDLDNFLTHPHSDYFQLLWDYGWIGIFLYFQLLKMIFKQLNKQYLNINFSLLVSFIAALIAGLTIGNLMIVSSRLFVYVCFMMSIYTITYLKTIYEKK